MEIAIIRCTFLLGTFCVENWQHRISDATVKKCFVTLGWEKQCQ